MNDPDPLSILAAFGAAEAPGAGPALGGMMLAVAGFILFLLLNAFFAAGEVALMKVRESQLHAGEGVPARTRKKLARARKAAKHPDLYLAACQAGITLSSLALGFLGTFFVSELTAPFLVSLGLGGMVSVYGIALAVTFIFFACCQVVFGEFIPKAMAMRQPDKAALATVPLLYFFYTVFRYTGILGLTGGMAQFVLKYLLGIDPRSTACTVHSLSLIHISEPTRH